VTLFLIGFLIWAWGWTSWIHAPLPVMVNYRVVTISCTSFVILFFFIKKTPPWYCIRGAHKYGLEPWRKIRLWTAHPSPWSYSSGGLAFTCLFKHTQALHHHLCKIKLFVAMLRLCLIRLPFSIFTLCAQIVIPLQSLQGTGKFSSLYTNKGLNIH